MACSKCCSICGLVMTTFMLIGVFVASGILFLAWSLQTETVDIITDGDRVEATVISATVERGLVTDQLSDLRSYRCIVKSRYMSEDYNTCETDQCLYWSTQTESQDFCDDFAVGSSYYFNLVDHDKCDGVNWDEMTCAFTDAQVDVHEEREDMILKMLLLAGIGGTIVCILFCCCCCSCLKKANKRDNDMIARMHNQQAQPQMQMQQLVQMQQPMQMQPQMMVQPQQQQVYVQPMMQQQVYVQPQAPPQFVQYQQ
ncbi:hypothetical protein KIPB_005264 [Kipferlia bialata]|uniref:Uncharacterized protein n=1 Tax=Kipferlia bialata TaxID=797122 RepID=A0A9K3CVS6_9EUKA|nr:hypothetical protein KIPB_003226 [Kipferlia bialata]GIQ83867.1 hypothetical protein KIPB_005264 [Kipferlia bialata]|eukprot:g3226.t1